MDAHVIAARSGAAMRLPGLRLLADERLARMVAGDRGEDAFVVLYERHHQALYRYCRSMVRDEGDAQDALQSAFAGAFAALRRGRRDAPVRPWLFTIVHNEAVSMMRRRRPEAALSESAERSTVTLEDRAEDRERLRLLVADLAQLPERQRQALVLKELNGLSHEEIATVLGASVGAAKQTLFEARRSLMEFAQGRAMACDEVCRAISDDPRYAVRRRRMRAHLQGCGACAAFVAGIETRRADLHALAPALPAFAATGLLARLLGGGSTHGGGSAGGLAGAATGKTLGLIASVKAAAAVALLASATAGVATVLRTGSPASQRSPSTMRPTSHLLSSPGSARGATSTPTAPSARTARVRMRSDKPRPKARSAPRVGVGTRPAATAARSDSASGLSASASSRSPSGVSPAVHSQTPPRGTPTIPPAGAHVVSPTRGHPVSPMTVRPSTPSAPAAQTTPTPPARSTPTPTPPAARTTATQPAGPTPTPPMAPKSTPPAPAAASGTLATGVG